MAKLISDWKKLKEYGLAILVSAALTSCLSISSSDKNQGIIIEKILTEEESRKKVKSVTLTKLVPGDDMWYLALNCEDNSSIDLAYGDLTSIINKANNYVKIECEKTRPDFFWNGKIKSLTYFK